MKRTNGQGMAKQHFAQGVDPASIADIGSPQQIIKESDLHRGEIVSHDALPRLDRLVEDTVALTHTFAAIPQERDAAYGS